MTDETAFSPPLTVLSEDEQLFRSTVRAFAEIEVAPHVRDMDEQGAIPQGLIVVTLDGDGQNDPADIPRLVETLRYAGRHIGLVAGRRKRRQDSLVKRLSSRFANGLRRRLLNDGVDDTGCGIRAIWRDLYLELPYFDHMHRFLPVLVQREGCDVVSVDVNHRPRSHGRSKYGTIDRALAGILDLAGVMWLQHRRNRARIHADPDTRPQSQSIQSRL